MAAPDRVYRYFTNLKAKDSVNDVYFIRCAKPLLTYIPNGAVTREQKEAAIKSLFKLDGILWLKNPDVPHTASDADIKVEVEDPTNPGQTIEIDDPDLGDPDRSGFIGYVFQNGDNAVFHDIRTGPINNGVQSIATDFLRRSWSRASRLRYREWFDPEVPNSDKGEAIILNDAGLNRRGECAVKDTQQHEEFTFDLYADGNCVFYYKGTYTAPIYNRATSWGIRYKTHAAPHIQNQGVLDEITANTIEENISIARGATLNFLTNPHPFKLGIGDSETLTVGDYFYFAPFITNEEGTYELPVDTNTYTIVPRFKLKVRFFMSVGSNQDIDFFNYLDGITSSTTDNFTEESQEYLSISDNNSQNTGRCGTMYFNSLLNGTNIDASNIRAYNEITASNYDPYKGAVEESVTGYHFGPLKPDENGTLKYFYVRAERTSPQSGDAYVKIIEFSEYEPVIAGVQGIFVGLDASWDNNNHTSLSYSFTVNNLTNDRKDIWIKTIQLRYFESQQEREQNNSHLAASIIDYTSENNGSGRQFWINEKSSRILAEGSNISFSGYNSSYIYVVSCTYSANKRVDSEIIADMESEPIEEEGGEVMP